MLRCRSSTDRRSTAEAGSAALEFLLAGVLLLVPLAYLVIAMAEVQSHALGAEAAARQIGRAVAESPAGTERADAILDVIAGEYRMDADAIDVSVSCAQEISPCPQPGSTVVVTVRAQARLPLASWFPGAVPVEAASAHRVARLWAGQ